MVGMAGRHVRKITYICDAFATKIMHVISIDNLNNFFF